MLADLADLAILANVTNLASCLDVVKVYVTGYWNAFFFFWPLFDKLAQLLLLVNCMYGSNLS